MSQVTSESSPDSLSGVILVVDDDLIKRYTTARTLERAGFTIVQADTGQEALRMAQQKPALVVLDVKLPDIDGFEVCRRLKAQPDMETTPVLHLSAHRTSGQDLAHGLEGGADGYLTLPVEPEVLVATVRALLRLHKAEEASRSAARYWQTTFDAIRDAVFLVDARGKISRCNSAASVLLNKPCETLVEGSLSGLLEEIGVHEGGELLSLQTAGSAELRTGGGRWLRLTVDPVYLEGAITAAGAVCTLSDVTEQVEAAAKNERIADMLQHSLLFRPETSTFPGMDVEGVYKAAWDEALVGGDFADAFAVAEGRIALVVGDVTGKGLRAATYTAEIKFALRAFLHESYDTAHALQRLNRYLMESRRIAGNSEETYVSLALAIVDTANCRLTCSAAGAEPPLVIRYANKAAEELLAQGPLLAMDLDSEYQATSAELARGDLLVLVTDGITEARPGRGRDFFGLEGVARAAGEAMPMSSLKQIAAAVVESALDFAEGRQGDDICLLIARCGETTAAPP